nr:hypothetical protein [Rhodospirillales bacterium]
MWEGIDHVLGLSGNPVLPGAVEATAGGTHTRRGLIPGTLHTSVGQEAQVVGACMALRPHDNMTGNHRSHGHPIGKATGARIGGVRYTDRLTGQRHALGAPVVVNAAGPWVDAVLSHDGKTTRRFIGGTKGSHLVVNPFPGAPRDVVYYESQSDGRLV